MKNKKLKNRIKIVLGALAILGIIAIFYIGIILGIIYTFLQFYLTIGG